MKVLIINTYFSFDGGAEAIAYNTYKILKNRGIETYFWASDKKPYYEKDYPFCNYFTRFNATFKDYIKKPYEYYYNNNSKRDLQKFINLIKPDIIHIHSFKTCLTSSILECCKNIPTILTVHDASLFCPSVYLMKNNKELCTNVLCKKGKFYNCIKNKCSKGSLEQSFRLALKSYIFIKNIKYINKFITPSDALGKLVLQSEIGIKKEQIITVNNFLENSDLKTIPNYSNKGYFLYIGRLSREKGVHYLLEAMNKLPKDIELHIAGEGANEKNLRKYATDNNLNNVKFLGLIKDKDMKLKEYQNCIATILPSNCFEVFGMTNIESLINGKPVIASEIGGIPEIIENNKNGLLFEPANVEQLKNCILKYWNNKELVIEHGEKGYKKVITRYTEDAYYNKLIKIYNDLL